VFRSFNETASGYTAAKQDQPVRSLPFSQTISILEWQWCEPGSIESLSNNYHIMYIYKRGRGIGSKCRHFTSDNAFGNVSDVRQFAVNDVCGVRFYVVQRHARLGDDRGVRDLRVIDGLTDL
jgi:hypothetical protein